MQQLNLSKTDIALLTLFLDRLTFDHYLACTDGNNDQDQAYDMQAVAGKLKAQVTAGFIPSFENIGEALDDNAA